jgi:CRISPR-associated protein Csb2
VTFALLAEFPLGYYRGHLGAGETDPCPSPARLHGALTAAAATGTRAVPDEDGSGLTAGPTERAALKWLETNPPDGLALPPALAAERAYVRFRKTGTIPFEGTKAKGAWKIKTVPDSPESSVALNGPVAFVWSKRPPQAIAETLAELALDVSNLGTAESPVRLTVGDAKATHRLDPTADLWAIGGLDLDLPQPGRLEALEQAHRRENGPDAKLGPEEHSGSDAVRPPPVVSAKVAVARFAAVDLPAASPLPWPRAVLLELDRSVRRELHVRWAVAFHRAIVRIIGLGAPPMITGRYEGVDPPANHLAIQLLAPGLPSEHLRERTTTAALLIPDGATPDDLETLNNALDDLSRSSVRGPGGRQRHIMGHRLVSADDFWSPGATPRPRHWRTDTMAVPDLRPPRGRRWTFGDAALLAVGLTWRDHLGGPGRGQVWLDGLRAAAAEAGARALTARRVLRSDLQHQVHKVHRHAVLSAYRAELELGTLAGPRSLVAIGQTRHLGGGLLVPSEKPS